VFCQIKLGIYTAAKLAINWQNFAQVGLQLKLAFRIRPLESTRSSCVLILEMNDIMINRIPYDNK